MTINYNVTGTERKRLADYISGFMGTDKKYLGAPTFAYQIGYITVSKDGAVSFEDRGYNSDIDALMAELEGQGFHTEDTITKADGGDAAEPEATSGGDAAQPDGASTGPEAASTEDEATDPSGYGLTVSIPADTLGPDALREQYPPGTRVELLRMDDPQAPPIGTRGTVRGVDDTGSIMVAWDSGGSLNVLYGVDQCRKVGE